jgi:hypothetical protein
VGNACVSKQADDLSYDWHTLIVLLMWSKGSGDSVPTAYQVLTSITERADGRQDFR